MKSGIFKRSAVVAALATAGVVAHADALPFNFYALLDAGVVSTSISGGGSAGSHTTEVRSSPIDPSFWGVISEKKLGDVIGGLQIESTLSTTPYPYPGSAPSSLGNRQANVYVKSDAAGKLEIGTITDPVFDTLLMVDPTSSGFGNTLSPWFQNIAHGSSDIGSVKYTSPTVAGFTGKVSYVGASAANTSGSNSTYGSGYRSALTYNQGDLNVVGAYEVNNSAGTSTSSTIAAGAQQNSAVVLGASYKIKALTLKAIQLTNRDNASTFTSNNTPYNPTDFGSLGTTGFGGSYDFSEKLQLTSGYYMSKDGKTAGKTNSENTSAWDTYLTYEFIKDLKVYGQYAKVSNNATAGNAFNFTSNYGTFANNNGAGVTGLSAGQSASVLSVGLHYGFF